MAKLPRAFQTFQRRYSKVFKAYESLGGVAHESGPLDAKTRELVKLGMAIGGRLEGAVRSHAHRALEVGATPREIEHVVLLAITTTGFPTAVAAFTWIEQLLGSRKRTRRKVH